MMAQTWRWSLAAVVCTFLVCEVCVPVAAFEDKHKPQINLTAKSAEHPAEFEVSGLPAAELTRLKDLEPTDPTFADVFAVHVAGQADKDVPPPVGGTYRVGDSRLIFTPRYPPLAGLTYRARLRFEGTDTNRPEKTLVKIEREFAIPKLADEVAKPTRVEHIYPTVSKLPENHLRFYIHFSQPIARGRAYENLELLDGAGKPLDAALLEIGEELWDPSGRRFTLLLDPGRVKQGLVPREELGPILENGKKYTLVVKKSWRDARGRQLAEEFRKSFSVGPAIHEPIDAAKWTVTAPPAGSTRELVVRFPRPLDRALLERTLSVIDADGKRVAGQVAIALAEHCWAFKPDKNWGAGRHQLVIDTVLEDTAGNSIARAFEVDELQPITRSITTETVKRPFEIIPLHSNPGRLP